jgi:chemotaxis protein methyltransferase CheR
MIRKAIKVDDAAYELFRTLILERSGLHFPEKRRQDLERGLAQAFAQSDSTDLQAYHHLLSRSPTSGPVWERLIAQLTIGETHFFRNRPQFHSLQRHILPTIITRNRSTRQIRVWSAGCASGEEPYSIAMLLKDQIPHPHSWNITILASDINREALEKAREGRFGAWSFRQEGWEPYQKRYFSRQGSQWRISSEIKEMVTFTYLNLVEDAYPSLANNTVAFDLILCRNVMIYFTPEITQRVVDQLYEALVDQGWLVVGHSEPSLTTFAQFEPHNYPGAILYQKTGEPSRFDLSWLQETKPPVQTARPVVQKLIFPSAKPEPLPIRVPPPRPEPSVPEPTPSAEQLCTQAEALLEENQVQKALELLHRALEEDRNCAYAYYLIGKSQADMGQWQEARRWVERSVECDPLITEAHLLLGLIYTQEDTLDQALVAMKRVVYLDRNAIIGHFCLANLYREMGQRARSRKSLQNTANLLEGLAEDAEIPWSDGMTAGRLRYIVQQQLNGES